MPAFAGMTNYATASRGGAEGGTMLRKNCYLCNCPISPSNDPINGVIVFVMKEKLVSLGEMARMTGIKEKEER